MAPEPGIGNDASARMGTSLIEEERASPAVSMAKRPSDRSLPWHASDGQSLVVNDRRGRPRCRRDLSTRRVAVSRVGCVEPVLADEAGSTRIPVG